MEYNATFDSRALRVNEQTDVKNRGWNEKGLKPLEAHKNTQLKQV